MVLRGVLTLVIATGVATAASSASGTWRLTANLIEAHPPPQLTAAVSGFDDGLLIQTLGPTGLVLTDAHYQAGEFFNGSAATRLTTPPVAPSASVCLWPDGSVFAVDNNTLTYTTSDGTIRASQALYELATPNATLACDPSQANPTVIFGVESSSNPSNPRIPPHPLLFRCSYLASTQQLGCNQTQARRNTRFTWTPDQVLTASAYSISKHNRLPASELLYPNQPHGPKDHDPLGPTAYCNQLQFQTAVFPLNHQYVAIITPTSELQILEMGPHFPTCRELVHRTLPTIKDPSRARIYSLTANGTLAMLVHQAVDADCVSLYALGFDPSHEHGIFNLSTARDLPGVRLDTHAFVVSNEQLLVVGPVMQPANVLLDDNDWTSAARRRTARATASTRPDVKAFNASKYSYFDQNPGHGPSSSVLLPAMISGIAAVGLLLFLAFANVVRQRKKRGATDEASIALVSPAAVMSEDFGSEFELVQLLSLHPSQNIPAGYWTTNGMSKLIQDIMSLEEQNQRQELSIRLLDKFSSALEHITFDHMSELPTQPLELLPEVYLQPLSRPSDVTPNFEDTHSLADLDFNKLYGFIYAWLRWTSVSLPDELSKSRNQFQWALLERCASMSNMTICGLLKLEETDKSACLFTRLLEWGCDTLCLLILEELEEADPKGVVDLLFASCRRTPLKCIFSMPYDLSKCLKHVICIGSRGRVQKLKLNLAQDMDQDSSWVQCLFGNDSQAILQQVLVICDNLASDNLPEAKRPYLAIATCIRMYCKRYHENDDEPFCKCCRTMIEDVECLPGQPYRFDHRMMLEFTVADFKQQEGAKQQQGNRLKKKTKEVSASSASTPDEEPPHASKRSKVGENLSEYSFDSLA